MSLHDVLQKRGYTFRRHLEEVGWGWHEPNVVDFDRMHADALHYGGIDGLREYMQGLLYRPPWGLWTFPSFDIQAPLPRRANLRLAETGAPRAVVVAPRTDPELWSLAETWIAQVRNRWQVSLTLRNDDAPPTLLDEGDLVIFGGAHRNRLALALALRYRTLFVDAGVPGDDGWVVTMHCGLHASGHNVVQVAAPQEHHAEVLDLLAGQITTEGDTVWLKAIHRIQPGATMRKHFPSWSAFTDRCLKRIIQLKGRDVTAPDNIRELSELLATGFDSGGFEKGIYNVAPVDIAIDCARYYQLSGDPRALRLFRELLFRLTDYYLKTPAGADYPADLDFRLGLLVLHFAQLEHSPVFDDEDRLILVNLLLATVRSVHEFGVKLWPHDRNGDSRHNHQTFPALTLLYAAEYFSRFNLPYLGDWRAYTERMFQGNLWHRYKHTENSRSYEPYVFEHAAAYSLFTGRGLSLFEDDCFEKMIQRQMIATDNFFRAVDYGDTAIHLNPVDSVSARLQATQQDGSIRWFAGEGFRRKPDYIGRSFHDFPGVRMQPSATPPPAGDWEHLTVDPEFLDTIAPALPSALAFDKLAFRTGWDTDDHYLLLEGIGGNVSHAHHDTNGLVRLNHLGRHWIVSNGYGKRPGITNASQAFSSRELGPADHNMLVLQRDDAIVRDLPMAALLQRGRQAGLLYATSLLPAYGGVNWLRTLVILAGRYVLVLDRIQVIKDGLQAAHVEWNGLGAVTPSRDGFRLAQDGVFMDLTTAGGAPGEHLPADQSACWKALLAPQPAQAATPPAVPHTFPLQASGGYPHAAWPLAKLVFRLPPLEAGSTTCLATLLAATRSGPAYAITQPEPGHVRIEGDHEAAREAVVTDGDLGLRVGCDACDVHFSQTADDLKAILCHPNGIMA